MSEQIKLKMLDTGGGAVGDVMTINGANKWQPVAPAQIQLLESNDGNVISDGSFQFLIGVVAVSSQQTFVVTGANVTLTVAANTPSIFLTGGNPRTIRVTLIATPGLYSLTLTQDSGVGISSAVDTGLRFTSGTTLTIHGGDAVEFALLNDGYYHELWSSVGVTRA